MRTLQRALRTSLFVGSLTAVTVLPDAVLAKEKVSKSAGSKKKSDAPEKKTKSVTSEKKKQQKPKKKKSDLSERKKVAVGGFEGPKSADVRGDFIDALKESDDYEVTDAEDVKPGAKDAAIVDAAKGLGVDVVITGKVKKGFNLTLAVRDGSDGSVIDNVEIKGGALPKLKKNVQKTSLDSVAGPIAEAKAVEEPKAEPVPEAEAPKEDKDKDDKEKDDKEKDDGEEKEKEKEEDEPADNSDGQRASPLDVTAGLRAYTRTFEFHQSIADLQGAPPEKYGLLRYQLPLGPALFIDLNWYPGAHFAAGPAGWVGITGGFEKGFATQSIYLEGKPGEKTLKTDPQAWYVGAKFRLPIAAHELGLAGVFGKHQFLLSGDETEPLVPDVDYTYVRVGLNGLFRIGDFLAGARVGKRFVLGTGDLEKNTRFWFPKTKAASLEAGVTVGYRLASMLDLVAGFDWLRYGFDFNPVPMREAGLEKYVAGGAVDQYLSGHLAFRFHLPEKGGDGPAPPTAVSAGASSE